MNNTALRIISAVLALGALGVAYLAIQLSKAPAAPAATAPAAAPKVTVAVTTRDIPAGQVLSSTDVVLAGVEAPPAQAYTQLQDVVGRTTSTLIPAKAPLQPSQFAVDTLANLLKPGERAVAVQVDEVIGVGGFAQPGEYVDVLAFLPKDGDNQGSAQTVVEDARLLTVGDASALDAQQAGHTPTTTEALTRDSGTKAATDKVQQQSMRSAVLAVREGDVNRLMLAANAGVLRLALRPPESAFDPNASLSKQAQPIKRAPVVQMSDLGHRATTSAQPSTGRKLIIQEGREERVLTAEKKDSP